MKLKRLPVMSMIFALPLSIIAEIGQYFYQDWVS